MALRPEHVVALVGGVGGAKLAAGLVRILPPEQLTIVVNTGDDFWHYGLRICPDLDTVMYTLGGLVDPVNGWGVAGDTTALLDALKRYGEDAWFRLGDQDVATHLLRSEALRNGERLTEVTRQLTNKLGILHPLLPMTDAPVETMIDTVEYGELPFQTYFVRYRWQPTMKALRYAGADHAEASPEVIAALENADAILIAPSNPWLSLAPMLAVKPFRELLLEKNVPRVAVSPIVAGTAIKGPAAKLMAELGYDVSPRSVADFYGDLISGFVYDIQDSNLKISGKKTFMTDTIMRDQADRERLAGQILDWITAEVWD
ncbi:MAG: LPPG:FO 2-phospho-L-lactate transferase [Chloroflexi bacterium OLB15]|nr:MAG: LPPG:FO 2-phospho-L-lactate transferase [Chloroflexi bacterium OLB15]